MTLRCTALAVMLAALALSPATAQEAGEQSSGTPAQAGQGGGMMMPGQGMGRGYGMGQGMMMPGCGMMMPGMGMMQGPGMMRGQGGGMGQGMMQGQGPGMGQGMMRGRGKAGGGMYGRHHRGRGAGPTLRIKTAGKGFEIDFECRASLENCLAAIERVYDIAGERRGAGPRSTE